MTGLAWRIALACLAVVAVATVVIAAGVFAFHLAWFDRRVRDDETRLAALFGDPYREYLARVKRWIPGLL